MKTFYALLVLFFHMIVGAAQHNQCIVVEDSSNYSQDEELLFLFNDYINNPGAGLTRTSASYNIPVVVHVLHQNGPENISDQQICDAIYQLNQTFAGTLGNEQVQDTDIKFHLAEVNRQVVAGVDVVVEDAIADPGMITDEDFVSQVDLTQWPSDMYLNIFVARCILRNGSVCDGGQALGVFRNALFSSIDCQPLNYIPSRDNIIMKYDWFGYTEAAESFENTIFSGVLSHEVAHYLGLKHTFLVEYDPNQLCEICPPASMLPGFTDCIDDTTPEVEILLTCGLQSSTCFNMNCSSDLSPLRNVVSYNSCRDRFTPLQIE